MSQSPFHRRPFAPAFALASLVSVVALALPLAGCSGTTPLRPRSGDDGQSSRMHQLEERVLELQREAAVARVELERLRRQVAALEGQLGGGTPRSTRSPSRDQSRDQEAGTESRPSGSSAPARPPVVGERERVAIAQGVDGRSGTIEVEEIEPQPVQPAPRREETVPPPAGRSAEPAAAEDVAGVTPEAQALYDRGYTFYHQGRYLDAESSFQRFLQSHSGTELADNAQYWIGESRSARGDVSGALQAFRETVDRYPEGNKVPDALLKVGDALAELGDLERARAAYAELVRQFPGSAAAAAAAERRRALP